MSKEAGGFRVPFAVRRGQRKERVKFRFPLGAEIRARWNGQAWTVELSVPGEETLTEQGASVHWVLQRLGRKWLARSKEAQRS